MKKKSRSRKLSFEGKIKTNYPAYPWEKPKPVTTRPKKTPILLPTYEKKMERVEEKKFLKIQAIEVIV